MLSFYNELCGTWGEECGLSRGAAAPERFPVLTWQRSGDLQVRSDPYMSEAHVVVYARGGMVVAVHLTKLVSLRMATMKLIDSVFK